MNKEFNRAFIAETGKIIGKKSMIKLIIAIIVLFVIFTVGYKFLYSIIDEAGIGGMIGANEAVTQEGLDELKAEYEEYKTVSSSVIKNKLMDTDLYSYRARIAAYEYLLDNNISSSLVRYFGSVSISTNGYIIYMLSIMTTVFVIYAIVSIGKLIGTEMQEGNIKMELLRPISRDALLAAKYTATLAVTIALFLITLIITSIIGIAFFKIDAKSVLVVLNAKNAGVISPISEIIIIAISSIITIVSFTQLTMCVSVMQKGKSTAIVVGIVMLLLASQIESLLGYLYIGYAGFAINLEFTNALSINTTPAMNYMNLYSMLAFTVFYIVLNTFLGHVLFKHKDIQ